MEGNQTWYNRAWLYTDLTRYDAKFKQEFLFLRRELDRMVKITPHIKRDTDTGTNTGNI
jgi:hypothetical protein